MPTRGRYRRFSTRRCADVDMGRWLTGACAIPAVDDDDPPEDGAEGRRGDGETSGG